MSLKDIVKIGQYYQRKYSKLTNVNVEPGNEPDIAVRLKNVQAWKDRLNSVLKNLITNVNAWMKSDNQYASERQDCLTQLNTLSKDLNSDQINEKTLESFEQKVLTINEKIGALTSDCLKYFPGQYGFMKPPTATQQFKSLQSTLLNYKNTAAQWMKSFPNNKSVQSYNAEVSALLSRANNMTLDMVNSEIARIDNKYKNQLAALTGKSNQIAQYNPSDI